MGQRREPRQLALGQHDHLIGRVERHAGALERVDVDAVRPRRVARLGTDPVADRDLVQPPCRLELGFTRSPEALRTAPSVAAAKEVGFAAMM